ncbi:MAG: ImmA/IrrE family metallo-endopeptidase [Limisphaerales bacterium]
MSDPADNLKLSIEWEDPCSAKGEELRATWCRLSIHVGQTPVTRVHDERAQTVREAVYCSAYPLAEWFAFNWWALLNESERPSSAAERHNLRFAREGFALPDLELFSEGSVVRAAWKAYRPASAPVRFLDEGFALLDRNAVVSEIRTFVGKVVARLESQGVSRTRLTEEWTAIRETSGAEREFCETAGALGLDPYDLEDKLADEILSIAKSIPVEIKREFFLAADSTRLGQQARWISRCLRRLGDCKAKTRYAGKKGLYRTPPQSSTPWQSGYHLARRFRAEFRVGNPTKPVGIDKLGGLKHGELPVIWVGEECQLDGVARLATEFGPQVATSKNRESSKTYLLARALCEYLCGDSAESALLTRISSDRQKRNRAFAAELLAPAEGIRKLLSGSRIPREEISEVAAHLGVSDWLVEHQVRNHRIATVEGTVPLPAAA